MAEWAKLKVVDLKAELKRRGLPQGGLKAELVGRLEENDAALVAEREIEEQVEVAKEQGGDGQGGDGEDAPVSEVDGGEEKGEDVQLEGDAQMETVPDAVPEVAAEQPGETDEAPEAAVRAPVAPAQPHEDAPPSEPAQIAVTSESEAASAPAPEPIETSTIQPDTPLEEKPSATANDEPRKSPSPAEQTEQNPEQMQIDSSAAAESQKRKRRSASPPLNEEDMARKRARAESRDDNMSVSDAQRSQADDDEHVQHNPNIPPPLHPPTRALYINNLMRPLRPLDIRTHLTYLAAAGSDDDCIQTFHLDAIRTHAFVTFDTTSQAIRVRNALHEVVWPNEANRKALWVDFVPEGEVMGWIEREEATGRGRAGMRWEVLYEEGADGVNVRLEEGKLATAAGRNAPTGPGGRAPPAGPAMTIKGMGSNNIPLGPRAAFRDQDRDWDRIRDRERDRDVAMDRDFNHPRPRDRGFDMPSAAAPYPPTASSGPRSNRPPPHPTSTSTNLSPTLSHTTALPSLTYQLTTSSLARARLSSMQKYYVRTREANYAPRASGRDINRYSFEDGDVFVDRGREVFEGIRPPHRERGGRRGGGRGRGRGGMGRDRRGGGGGGFGGMRGGDSWVPGGEGRLRDERRQSPGRW